MMSDSNFGSAIVADGAQCGLIDILKDITKRGVVTVREISDTTKVATYTINRLMQNKGTNTNKNYGALGRYIYKQLRPIDPKNELLKKWINANRDLLARLDNDPSHVAEHRTASVNEQPIGAAGQLSTSAAGQDRIGAIKQYFSAELTLRRAIGTFIKIDDQLLESFASAYRGWYACFSRAGDDDEFRVSFLYISFVKKPRQSSADPACLLPRFTCRHGRMNFVGAVHIGPQQQFLKGKDRNGRLMDLLFEARSASYLSGLMVAPDPANQDSYLARKVVALKIKPLSRKVRNGLQDRMDHTKCSDLIAQSADSSLTFDTVVRTLGKEKPVRTPFVSGED